MSTIIDYRLNGIPCQVVVDYTPGTNFYIHSASTEPNEPEEIEITVLDRKGRRAEWLDRYLTPKDENALLNMVRSEAA